MPIYLGNTEINTEYVDSYGLGRIYLGSDLVQSNLDKDFTLTYMVLGGGGGGGQGGGGGGGGGQFITGSFTVTTNQPVGPILIGAGGKGGGNTPGADRAFNGESSSFYTFTSIGGGAGGEFGFAQPENDGYDGASGGGGGGGSFQNAGGTGSIGFNGGRGLNPSGGGGGGSTSAGGIAGPTSGGDGGSGSIGDTTYFQGIGEVCGGGGGGDGGDNDTPGTGRGGGGNGGNSLVTGSSGTANTGGGGGGGGEISFGGNGGSGLVALSYPNNISASVSPGLSFTKTTIFNGLNLLRLTSGSGTVSFR
jgi:hypothetical protein